MLLGFRGATCPDSVRGRRIVEITGTATQQAADTLLYTPAEAAARIGGGVTEAWLRRKAGRREIPRTMFMGKLAFSEQNIADMLAQFSQAPRRRRR
jgi:hypothetical protein